MKSKKYVCFVTFFFIFFFLFKTRIYWIQITSRPCGWRLTQAFDCHHIQLLCSAQQPSDNLATCPDLRATMCDVVKIYFLFASCWLVSSKRYKTNCLVWFYLVAYLHQSLFGDNFIQISDSGAKLQTKWFIRCEKVKRVDFGVTSILSMRVIFFLNSGLMIQFT